MDWIQYYGSVAGACAGAGIGGNFFVGACGVPGTGAGGVPGTGTEVIGSSGTGAGDDAGAGSGTS